MTSAHAILSSKLRTWVWGLLTVSLVCNLAVLFLPFMDLRLGLSTDPYTLFSSIRMLWEAELYVLVLFVVGFSVLFPFAKLATLAWVCASKGGIVSARKERWLLAVEKLGKWSMLDVFLVCLILSLTSDQLLVGARPLIGIPLFVTAISLSMAAGELLAWQLSPPPANRPVEAPALRSGTWMVLAGIALGCALFTPFLQISDWKLAGSQYSIVSIIPVLWQQQSETSAVVLSLYLIVFPVLGWLMSIRVWKGLLKGVALESAYRSLYLLRRWSMLDVFALALAIFLVEGDHLMETEVRVGAIYLLALLAFQQLFRMVLDKSFSSLEGG